MTAPLLTNFGPGSPASAVSADLMNTLMQSCDNFAQLRAFVGATGQSVFARGASTIGDGQQGIFYWKTGSVFVDDGVNTIVPPLAFRSGWVRLTTVSPASSTYLQAANNLSDVPSKPTALANLLTGTSSLTLGSWIANETIASAASAGAFSYGTLSYTDTNLLFSGETSVNSYAQLVVQNQSAGAASSADFVVSNNLGTATTYYGNFGINGSGFTGTGSFNLPNATYLSATSGDLVLGTTTANAIRFVVNNGATDVMDITSAGLITAAMTGPSWASYANQYNGLRVAVNGFPVTSQFGSNSSGITEAITGAVDVSAASTAGNHCSGVAGYARTNSNGQGSVGIFGAGMMAGGGTVGTGASTWSANTVVTNAPVPNPATNTGVNYAVLYGMEMDFNLMKTGGAAPNAAMRGIYMTGASETAPAGGSSATLNAVDIESYGVFQSPKLAWNNGFYTNDGACVNGISLGAATVGNGYGSQPIVLRGTTAGAAAISSSIQMDASGNLAIKSNSGSSVQLANGGTDMLTCLPGSYTRIQNGCLVLGSNGLGYLTGAGGAVTQVTSRSTGVTLNTVSGQITLVSVTANTVPSITNFTLTNSTIGANDTVSVVVKSAANLYAVSVYALSAGQCSIVMQLLTAAGAVADVPVLQFNVIKGAIA